MKLLLPVLLLPVMVLSPLGAQPTKKYRGAWFEIDYPADFKLRPSLQSGGMPDEFDSAFFESPDKKVRFYIFSPQWSGESPDITLKDRLETYHLEKTENVAGLTKTWYTIRPKTKGFTRSYVETTNADKTIRWVIGIEYADQKSYQKYQAAYLAFKKSLRQFAD